MKPENSELEPVAPRGLPGPRTGQKSHKPADPGWCYCYSDCHLFGQPYRHKPSCPAGAPEEGK